MKEDFLDPLEHQVYQDCQGYKVPLALQDIPDHQVPQALLAFLVRRGKWA